MSRHRLLRGLKILLIITVALAVMGFVLMNLWNWLMPAIFGLHAISFWQALGMVFLSKILFGGFRGGLFHSLGWRRRFIERWEQMTPEEREKFRAGMRGGCGRRQEAAGSSQ
jgi:hypothetical protein